MKKFLLVCISVGLLVGCSTQFRIGDFTVISTKNINLKSNSLIVGEKVKGVDESTSIAYLKNAVDNAIEHHKCAVGLSNAVLKLQRDFFTVSYIAEGNLIIDKSQPNCK